MAGSLWRQAYSATCGNLRLTLLRGPVGLNRVYAEVSAGPLQIEPWLAAIKAGRTFATNGPLLRFSLGGQPIGGEVRLEKKPQKKVHRDTFLGRTIFDRPRRSSSSRVQRQGRTRTYDRRRSYSRARRWLDPDGREWLVRPAYGTGTKARATSVTWYWLITG